MLILGFRVHGFRLLGVIGVYRFTGFGVRERLVFLVVLWEP